MLSRVRNAISTAPMDIIRTSYSDSAPLPLLVEPAIPGLDLGEWVGSQSGWIEEQLSLHGGIVFRGFDLSRVDQFEAIAARICPELYADYGDLPPEGSSQKVYQSTPYPSDLTILFHNESSHLTTWPLRQFFFCMHAAPMGGDTPLIDCREICRQLPAEILDAFDKKGLLYVRNFVEGVDVSWRQFFQAEDRSKVERQCEKLRIEFEWTANDGLRLRTRRPAVVNHPLTGERIFFNQVQLHHVACLPEQIRTSLLRICRPEDLPRQVYFGDGSEISAEWMQELDKLYWRICRRLPWRNGDIFVLDNMLVAHARCPFAGPRRIAVAMGRMIGDEGIHLA